MRENGFKSCQAWEIMQTTAQNNLSRHSEWKFINLTVKSLNSNLITQFKRTMGKNCWDLNKPHTGAERVKQKGSTFNETSMKLALK